MDANKRRRYAGKSVIRRTVKIMPIVVGALLGCVAVLTAALLVMSPGRGKPYTGTDGEPVAGSLSEKIWVSIGGIEQGMFIKGKSADNPVMLFVHGGPGMPEYFLAETYDTGLEDRFTVCYWEQRGAGLSHHTGMTGDGITAEQLVSDTIDVTNYLRARFGQDKIYLMAHSWGTFLGIQAAAKAPELYHAYIGVAQMADAAESERQAYAYMLERYRAAGDASMVRQLSSWNLLSEQTDTALIPYFKSMLRDKAMHQLGVGTMHDMNSVVTGVFLPVMTCRAYTLGEKINVWRAKTFLRSETGLINQLFTTKMANAVPKLDIPAYFLCGAYDYTVSYDLSKAYFGLLKAPVKGFYTFAQSAHSPMFEEPQLFMDILTRDVLTGQTGLADAA